MGSVRMFLMAGAAMGVLSGVPALAQVKSDTQATTGAILPPDQSRPASTPADASQGDIIVTAQRRSESLQRTPVAVSVLSGDTISRQAITSERDLQISAPGLTVKAQQNDNQLNYSLRGQTVDTYTSSLPSVLPYVNEVQVGGLGQSAFYDLQSIQVVKGPQGTLFGRNATGGAVLFTTAKPTEETSGYGVARYGSFNNVQLEGAVSGAVVPEVLQARVAGFFERRDGYQTNLFYDTKLGNRKRFGVRGSITLKPGSGITNDLVVDYLHDRGTNITPVIYNAVPVSANVPGNPFVPNNVFFPGLAQAAIDQRARGPFVANVDSLNGHALDKLIVSNISSIELGSDTTLKNVFGYVNIAADDAGDIDGTQFGIDGRGTAETGAFGGYVRIHQFSEELQLLGKTLDDRLEYAVGVYAASIVDHSRNVSFIEAGLGVPPQTNAGTTTSRSIAGYTQATYDTGLAGFKLTGGLRYTSEQVTFRRDADDLYTVQTNPTFAPFYADGRFIAPQRDTFNKVSWTVGLQNQVTSDLLLYVNSRRSFRSGGFNFHAPPTPGFADQSGGEFRPEIATDLELGAKLRGNAGGAPFSLNLAVYNMWVENVQRAFYGAIYGGLAGITVNVPKSEVTGFELDGTIRPTSWLAVGGNLNYTNARFTSNQVPVLGTNGGTAIAEFSTYPDTPRWSGLAFADITAPVSQRYDAVLHGDVYAQTSNYFSSTGKTLNPGTLIPGYSVTNFRIGLQDNSGKGWSLSGIVKNAFKRTYYSGGIGFASLFALNVVVPGEPRTFLAEVRYRF